MIPAAHDTAPPVARSRRIVSDPPAWPDGRDALVAAALARPPRLPISAAELDACLDYLDLPLDHLAALLTLTVSERLHASRPTLYRHRAQDSLPLDLSLAVRYVVAREAHRRGDADEDRAGHGANRFTIPDYLLR